MGGDEDGVVREGGVVGAVAAGAGAGGVGVAAAVAGGVGVAAVLALGEGGWVVVVRLCSRVLNGLGYCTYRHKPVAKPLS